MNSSLRRMARRRAGRRCEYCRIHEDDEPFAFHLDHIIPKKHGGRTQSANLAWCCHCCNLGKASNLAGRMRGEIVALFNPRRQSWSRHFRWTGSLLVGKTKCGGATIKVLNINREDRVWLRTMLKAAGTFPPR